MSKVLLLLRHAKSSWSEAEQPDHDRPLSERGERDAPRVGRLLRDTDRLPDAILSSTAVRARRTAEIVADLSGYGGRVETYAELYLASPETYVRTLRTLDEERRVLVVGHNPGLEQLATLLTGTPLTMPTAALAEIQLAIASWSDLYLGHCGELVDFWTPKH